MSDAEAVPRPGDARSIWRGMLGISSAIGSVAGIVSIVLLVQQAFSLGVWTPIGNVMDWYASTIQLLFSPVAPFVESVLTQLQHWRPDAFHPAAEWRHYLVIGIVMLGASFRAGRHPTMHTAGLSLFLISLVTALTAGSGGPRKVILFLVVLIATAVLFAISSVYLSRFLARNGSQPASEAWDVREAFAYIRSIGVVFGGAALFIALNAGLSGH
jgi:hypothetical protein